MADNLGERARKFYEKNVYIVDEPFPHIAVELGANIIKNKVILNELLSRLEYLSYKLGWIDELEEPEADSDGWTFVQAGSHWGSRCAWYQVVGGVLVLRDRGEGDNLARNDEALDFEGLTLEQAHAKAEALNSEPSGQNDGSHLACWSIQVQAVDDPADYGAEFLTYQEPPEAAQLRELIRAFLQKKASFADLQEIINVA